MARPLRYTFILVLVALGTLLAAISGWRYARASAPVNGPIILISIDALRADHLSAYGYRAARTPALDTLATDGIVFERAYSHVPQTLPAHAALLTGRLPFENGVRDSAGFALKSSERLLPEMLRDRGFATGGVVSSILLRKETGIAQGFDFFDDEMPLQEDGDAGLSRDGLKSERVAEKWLDSVGTSRAFLFLHLDDPRTAETRTEADAEVSPYDQEVAHADEAVGQLLRYLKAHQLYDQSTIIVVSDHGEGLGDHGERQHGLLVYDDALRVPLIVKPSAGEGAGRRIRNLVQHVDVVPTILDLAKAPSPGNLRGRSLTPLVEGNRYASDPAVYAESLYAHYHFGWGEVRSVRDGRYHYLSAPREELYDLDSDPGERNNLAEARPEVLNGLRKKLKDFGSDRMQAGKMAPVTSEDRERYDALGYVGSLDNAETDPAGAVADAIDPKDKTSTVAQFRSAVNRVTVGDLNGAIDRFRALAHEEPGMLAVWLRLADVAERNDRLDLAVDSYQHALKLSPASEDAALGAASALLRLRKIDQSRQYAQQVLDDAASNEASESRAHELLARLALARRDYNLARDEAALAEGADPGRPVTGYVNGRIALDQRRYAEALELFEEAVARLDKDHRRPFADLHLYAAESLLRAERYSEAEYYFLEELKNSPRSSRARTGLTAVYRATRRADEVAALAQH